MRIGAVGRIFKKWGGRDFLALSAFSASAFQQKRAV